MSKEQDRDDARRARAREVGLFRYGLIQDALDPALSTKQRGRLVRAVAARTHPGPFGTPVRVSWATLDRWIRDYRRGGFAALVPAPRRVLPATPAHVFGAGGGAEDRGTGSDRRAGRGRAGRARRVHPVGSDVAAALRRRRADQVPS
ncbi:MAG TPA: helix-turn-helix domain-containing protein, partial [Actinomycetota bacterium]|nr:helix-turn-helix domain-containing protein [Actinomycetota bacterium]